MNFQDSFSLDYNPNTVSNSIQYNSNTQSRNTIVTMSPSSGIEGSYKIKKRKPPNWSHEQKDALYELAKEHFEKVDIEIQQKIKRTTKRIFYTEAATALKTTAAACKGVLTRWSEQGKELSWSLEHVNQLEKIVYTAHSFKEGYKIAGKKFGKTAKECQKCMDDYKGHVIRKKFFNEKIRISRASRKVKNSNVAATSKKRKIHDWSKREEDDLINIIKYNTDPWSVYKPTRSIYKTVVDQFNKDHGTDLSLSSVKNRYIKLINQKQQFETMELTEETKDDLFKIINECVCTKSQQRKQELCLRMEEIVGSSMKSLLTKLSNWFSGIELQLLKTEWSDEQQKLLVEIIQAESSLEKGYQAAAKKFQVEEWMCKVRFQDRILGEFQKENSMLEPVLKPIDEQKSNASQSSKSKKKRKTPPTTGGDLMPT